MKRSLERGERIELRGFGIFNVRPRKTGIGRNPRTGAEVAIPPGKAVRFKPGKELQRLSSRGAPRDAQRPALPGLQNSGAPSGTHFYAYMEHARPRPRYWLHLLLLLLTLLTTTVAGAGMALSFHAGQPFRIDDIYGYQRAWNDPGYLLNGLPFSLTLVGVLLAHELGHYFTARYYLVDASLPYFLPVPTLIGTFGAFIRIRSAIVSKRILFDVGIAGPLAGFAALIVPLIVGVALSQVAPGVNAQGDVVFGAPLLFRFVEAALFPGVAPQDIYLHPMARAAWVGVLATALNLLPIGQLDGGHIVYAFLGERTRYLSWILVAVLIPMGFLFAYSWLLWAVLLFFFGLRHPSLVDPSPIGPTRTRLAILAAAIFVVSFTPSPIQ